MLLQLLEAAHATFRIIVPTYLLSDTGGCHLLKNTLCAVQAAIQTAQPRELYNLALLWSCRYPWWVKLQKRSTR